MDTSQPPEPSSPGQNDDFEAASQSVADYVKDVEPYQQNRRRRRRGFWIFLGILLLVGAGAVVYLYKHPHTKAPVATTPSVSKPVTAAKPITHHYQSRNFPGLEFDYPDGWTVNEPDGGTSLTLRSKTLKLKTVDGQNIDGQIVFSVQPKGTQLPIFAKENPTAILESDKIAYLKPSQTQRGSTYVSYLHNSSDAEAGGLNGIYITGDKGYQKDQIIPKEDFTPLDPLIGVTFVACQTAECATTAPVSLQAGAWAADPLSKQVTALLQSIIAT